MDKCWCGNSNLSEYSQDYYRCDKCKTLVSKYYIDYDANNINDDGGDFYSSRYWKEKMLDEAKCDTLEELKDMYFEERAIYWLKNFYQYILPGSGKVAEVGCGLGQFSYYLKLSGYEQIAFELSPEICQYIRDDLNINIHCGALYDTRERYDAITSFDVLEHLTEPDEFIKLSRNVTNDKGILFFQTPCYDPELTYEEMLVHKPNFVKLLKSKEHVYIYSRDSVTKLLRKYGFEYINFIDAFFGNDYDMFFVASKIPIHIYDLNEAIEVLRKLDNGYLLRTLIKVWNDREICNIDREDRLQQIVKLTNMIHTLEDECREYKNEIKKLNDDLTICNIDREYRLQQIIKLTNMVHKLEDEYRNEIKKLNDDLTICNIDREDRLQQIIKLTNIIHKLEAEYINKL